jgi:hypothetical protein
MDVAFALTRPMRVATHAGEHMLELTFLPEEAAEL